MVRIISGSGMPEKLHVGSVRSVDSPPASSEKVRLQMSGQRRSGTAVELAIRTILHRDGLRYRIDRSPIPGLRRKADILFGPARVAVMVDGCFWHSCPVHATRPKANAQWWTTKLERNVERDADTNNRLAEAGWEVIRVWEHEAPEDAARRIEKVVRRRRRTTSAGHQPS
jgi:DNA mismatch endonuclease (patch repair protein)